MPVRFVDTGLYKPLNDTQIRQLAKDILAGLVFTSEHIPSADVEKYARALMVIFEPYGKLSEEALRTMMKEPPGLLYSYYGNQVATTKDGWPIFNSVVLVGEDDALKVWEYYQKYKEAQESV